jgi:hypothetical protein
MRLPRSLKSVTQSAWWWEQYLYGSWRPLLQLLLGLYIVIATLNVAHSILHFFIERFSRDEALTRQTFLFFTVALVLRLALLFGLPYWIAVQYRVRAASAKLSREDHATRKKRNYIANRYSNLEKPPITIFFPDAYEDDLSVCAYTGGAGAFPEQRGVVRHLNAASIIALPHVSIFNNSAEVSSCFVMPEVRVHAAGPRAPFLHRLRRWISEQLDYIFRSQVREYVDRMYAHSGKECAYAQEPDVERGLAIVSHVVTQMPSPSLVLFGCGRGANVALEVYARLQNPLRRLVKGVVLEAPIADPILLTRFTRAYRTQHPTEFIKHPLNTLQTFPNADETRFLIVVSRADELADTNSLTSLHRQLGQRTKKGCELVRLHSAPRGAYATDNGKDALTYEEAALNFYCAISEDSSIH